MKKLLGLIGLCARAGRLVSGEGACEKLIRSGKAQIAFLDEGASDNARKALQNACGTYGVTLVTLPEGELGRMSGKEGRMAAATADESFARSMLDRYRLLSGVHELNGKSQGAGRD